MSGIARWAPVPAPLTDDERRALRLVDGISSEPESVPEVRQTRREAMPQTFGRHTLFTTNPPTQ